MAISNETVHIMDAKRVGKYKCALFHTLHRLKLSLENMLFIGSLEQTLKFVTFDMKNLKFPKPEKTTKKDK